MTRLAWRIVAALAALAALIAASAPAAGAPLPWAQAGDDIDHAASVDIRMMPRGWRCSAAPAPGGWYTAGHCLALGWPLLPDGRVRAWSHDPTRDLAHVADTAAGPAVALGMALPGDALTWRNARGWGAVRVVGERAMRYWPWEGDVLGVTCWVGGLAFIRGDSGTGLYRAADGPGGPEGALIGLFVGGELDPAAGTGEYTDGFDDWCGVGQMTMFQVVP